MEKFQLSELELLEKKLNEESVPNFYILDSVFANGFSDFSSETRLGIFFGSRKISPKWQIEQASDSLLFVKNRYRVKVLFTITRELAFKDVLPSSGLHYEIFDEEIELTLNDYVVFLEPYFEDDGSLEAHYDWDYEKIIRTFFPSFIKNAIRRCAIVNSGLSPIPVKIEDEYSKKVEFLEFNEDEADRWYSPFSHARSEQIVRGCYAKILEYNELYPGYINMDDIGRLIVESSIPKRYSQKFVEFKASGSSSFNGKTFSFKLRVLESIMPRGEVKKVIANAMNSLARTLSNDQKYVLRLYGNDDTIRYARFSTKRKALKELRRLRQIQPLSFNDITSDHGYLSSE